MNTIQAYERPNGDIGIRNHLLIIPTVICSNQVSNRIMQMVPDTVAIPHQHGCSQIGADKERTFNMLAGTGKNPNVGGVIIISLGCEVVDPAALAAEIRKTGKPVEMFDIQSVGGSVKAITHGIEIARKMKTQLDGMPKVSVPISKLKVGVKCGGSDATSGLASNPALGSASDILIGQGGGIVIGETTEIIGAEHVLAERCTTPEMKNRMFEIVDRFEKEVERMGSDMRGGNPSPGNIAGGLSTIEEKSLGCISKCGTAPINGIIEYAEAIPESGLYFMDSPGNDIECVSGMAAGGAHIVCFTTGRGTPTGAAVLPVIKITGNQRMYEQMSDNMDVDVSGMLSGELSLEQAGIAIWQEIVEVANGKLTKAEILGHQEFSINRIGPSL
ncbi:UxaA family hydrolase [Paenibacillus urinalis]|uniref:UxaA family hydrolase n=1 Tax=Paenibacillus urinalis TaxID=521520 RepID=A0AAX3MVI7_9BACL|nr:UxaA family hydrolase [Paenibacillus urinalis]WDH80430.1 UxaA family hydrolase [Paenibacillus urinalis]WDH96471.1 UxaA family hydrolase [Paenibacillus urinalis]WDI04694.1 UxaA family hydrolase [Paenibacillus urinalis]